MGLLEILSAFVDSGDKWTQSQGDRLWLAHGDDTGRICGSVVLHSPDFPLHRSLSDSRRFLTFPDKQHPVAVEREGALTTSSYAIFDI